MTYVLRGRDLILEQHVKKVTATGRGIYRWLRMASAMWKVRVSRPPCVSQQAEQTVNITQVPVRAQTEPTSFGKTSNQSLNLLELEVSHLSKGKSDVYLPGAL